MNDTLTTLFAGIGLGITSSAIGALIGWHLTGLWIRRWAKRTTTAVRRVMAEESACS